MSVSVQAFRADGGNIRTPSPLFGDSFRPSLNGVGGSFRAGLMRVIDGASFPGDLESRAVPKSSFLTGERVPESIALRFGDLRHLLRRKRRKPRLLCGVCVCCSSSLSALGYC